MSAAPPIEDPSWDIVAAEIGGAILHERAQLPPVVLGRCELVGGCPLVMGLTHVIARGTGAGRCTSLGILVGYGAPGYTAFLCPRHGGALDGAVRLWPR